MEPTEVETLRYLEKQQHEELQYRRSREFQIFTWSATIQLTIIAAVLVKPPDLLARGGWISRVGLSVIVLCLTSFSLVWQLQQRRLAAMHQQVLVRIVERLGAFDPKRLGGAGSEALYPEEWRGWGTRHATLSEQFRVGSKISATLAIGGIAAMFSLLC
jgi:hypothetical protein